MEELELSKLKEFLIASIAKNGDKPLTLQHLVNIIRMIERNEERRSKYDDMDWGDMQF